MRTFKITDNLVSRPPLRGVPTHEIDQRLAPWYPGMPEEVADALATLADKIQAGEYIGAFEAYLGITVEEE